MTATGCTYDESRVYLDGSGANGCHRSDVAQIVSAQVPVALKINVACSGAQTRNIVRGSSGGEGQAGEPPQPDQLAEVAARSDVKLIVLNIGGNDLDFAAAVTRCIFAYVQRGPPCRDAEQAKLNAALPNAMAGVAKAIDQIRQAMRSAGYRPWEYRLVLQTYPSVLPRARENRYAETGAERGPVGNCPFYDTDSDWARDLVVPQIANALRAVAAAKNVQLLDVRDALQEREICSTATRQADRFNPPSPIISEWARFAGQNSIAQGELEESFHPSAYGQMALGRCLTLMFNQPTGSWACTNTPGRGPEGMTLSLASRHPDRFKLRLHASRRRAVAGRRTCVRFRVFSGEDPVERVTLRLARTRRITTASGRARICVRLRARPYRVSARRRGFRPASTRITALRRGRRSRR